MTFAAQPYERFFDDLLMSLTGGISREEHPFVGVDKGYALTVPGAYGPSLRVYGQHGERYTVFDQGADYDYDPALPGVRWRPDGRLPDEDGYFYVSYDLVDVQRRLTDRNPGSVGSVVAGGFGRELAVLHRQLEQVYYSGFVGTATGASLDHVAALLGITRKDARFASGEVLFSRSTPAPGDIAIPSGTLVSTAEGVVFETAAARTLRRNQLSVIAPVRAVIDGATGRVTARAIGSINRPMFGVEAVTNERPTAFATERERDDELRRRIVGSLERAGKSTLDAIRYALIEELPELTDANIQVTERKEAAGFVEVRLAAPDGAGPDFTRRVEDAIFNARPAGVRVRHNLPTRTPDGAGGSDSAILRGAARAVLLPDGILARQPDGIVALRVHVLLRLAERNMAAAQQDRIADGVRSRLVDYVDVLPMGSDIVYGRLVAATLGDDKIVDAIVLVGTRQSGETIFETGSSSAELDAATLDAGLLPAAARSGFGDAGIALTEGLTSVRRAGRGWEVADAVTGQTFDVRLAGGRCTVTRGFHRVNVATIDRKARLDPADVEVVLMDELVAIDVRVLLEARPETGTGSEPPRVTSEVQQLVEATVRGVVAGAAPVRRVDAADAVRSLLGERPELGLQLAAGDAVTVNAEYVETGRLLNATDEVPLDEHHLPELRRIDVSAQGPLDV